MSTRRPIVQGAVQGVELVSQTLDQRNFKLIWEVREISKLSPFGTVLANLRGLYVGE
jgi:hypothetical protein